MEGSRQRLWVHVATGLALGVVYAIVGTLLDAELIRGRIVGGLRVIHELVDHVLPVMTGALGGAVVFALGQRGRLAASERKRAEALRLRVEKVERDQAVWVLAATVLHEVKNPLHSLGLLLDELATNGAQRSDLVERAQAQIVRISDELKLLRTLQRRGRPDRVRLALDELLTSIAEDLRPLVPAGVHLGVVCDPGIAVIADPAHVRLIVENLVDNAIHAPREPGAAAEVTLSAEAHDEVADIIVRDNGNGPDPAMARRLFDPLHTTKAAGLGLGLAVSRALARGLDGEVRYDGHADGWTTFRVTLPREQP